jgi:hypothetical protein
MPVGTGADEPGTCATATAWTAVIAVATCAAVRGTCPGGVKVSWPVEAPEGVLLVTPPTVVPIRLLLVIVTTVVPPPGRSTVCEMLATV